MRLIAVEGLPVAVGEKLWQVQVQARVASAQEATAGTAQDFGGPLTSRAGQIAALRSFAASGAVNGNALARGRDLENAIAVFNWHRSTVTAARVDAAASSRNIGINLGRLEFEREGVFRDVMANGELRLLVRIQKSMETYVGQVG